MIRDIAGRQNHSVKLARKLQKKKHRRERGLLVGEGMDLLLAAVRAAPTSARSWSGANSCQKLPAGLREQAAASGPAVRPPRHRPLTASTSACATRRPSTTPVRSAVPRTSSSSCAQPVRHLGELDLGGDLVFFLDCVGDPGNVGTLVRSAVAFGLGGVICSPGTADPYSPKALRGGHGRAVLLAGGDRGRSRAIWRHGSRRSAGRGEERAAGAGRRSRRTASTCGTCPAPRGLVVVLGSERTGPVARMGARARGSPYRSAVSTRSTSPWRAPSWPTS